MALAVVIGACGRDAEVVVLDQPILDVRPVALGGTSEPAAAPEETSEAAGFRLGDVTGSPEFTLVLPVSDDQLALRWWEWAASEPDATNPVVDTTGQHCARNQPDDVWFLAGTFGTSESRTCTVPAGREIFVPLLNWICAPEDGCDGSFRDDNRSALLVKVSASEAVPQPIGEPIYLSTHGSIATTPNNSLTGQGGTFDVAVGGWWIRLDGLESGNYVLNISGSQLSGGFSTEVEYSLTVQ